ncbi:hypothetical protein [Pseudomonas sivasensis]|uniref:hypothetical protein n=1 Tax=Pseudomonas sivasensis TaxID=1880678 RepID=UPI0015EC9F9A|nr:hypothetical protein [Pseudomonas sivasensis]MBA2930311.1 hypothetical protein [Pseudomonas sivasensis]
MSVADGDVHPASRVLAHSLARIADAPTALEARRLEIRTHDPIFKLQLEETISNIDADNLRICFRLALEKRLYEILSE